MKYIATRPRAERLGNHGLFSDEENVDLEKATDELDHYTGNVWTHIISLKREDAARLGYDNAKAWMNLLRANRNDIAAAMNMRDTLENLYFGKITPNEQDISPGSLLANAMDRAEQYEEKLTARLEGEEKTLLLRLLNAENEISSTMALENFILGFRLGMRMAMEALDEDDGSLTMYREEG